MLNIKNTYRVNQPNLSEPILNKTILMNVIRERLMLVRQFYGYSQLDMAKILEITPGGLQKFESGERAIKLERLERVTEHFNVPIDFIMGRIDKITLVRTAEIDLSDVK